MLEIEQWTRCIGCRTAA